MQSSQTKKIKTGIKVDDLIGREILDSVSGQLSDGYYENSSRMDQYWQNIDVIDEGEDVVLEVGNACDLYYKSDAEILAWWASKAKTVCKYLNNKWERNNQDRADGFGYDTKPTVADVYRVYDTLKGRTGHVYGQEAQNHIDEKEQLEKSIKQFINNVIYSAPTERAKEYKQRKAEIIQGAREGHLKYSQKEKLLERLNKQFSDVV